MTTGDAPYYAGVGERIGFLNRRPRWHSYLFAVALTFMAIGLRSWLDMLGEDVVPFSLFYPVVLACTLVGGVGPGLLAVILFTGAATIFWLEPRGVLALTPIGLINLSLFALANAAIIAVAHYLRSSYARLLQSEERLNLAQDVGEVGIWDLDLRSGELWWSPSFYKVTGFAPDQRRTIGAAMAHIHPDDYVRTVAAFDAARRGVQRLDVEFRFNRNDGRTIWLAGRAELFRDDRGRPARLIGINFDVTTLRTIAGERDRAHTLLQTFFDCFPGGAYAKDAEGRILLGNPGFAAAVGLAPEGFLGKTDLELLRDRDQALAITEHDRAVLASGKSQPLEEDLLLPDGRMTHWMSIKTPFKDADGQVKGIVGISLDMTERRRAEKRARLLADEVDHRAKNLLGVVQSIVRLTRVEDVAVFKSVLTGRIQALGRAHSLLAASRWDGVDLAALVREELAPFDREGGEQVRISGPSLMLSPNASQAVAMVLHELAINAARYGALSVGEGRLTVDWKIVTRGGAAQLELTWSEAYGPAVVTPVQPGFGFATMQGAIEHQLGGKITKDWATGGVVCHILFPADRHVLPNQAVMRDESLGEPGRSASDIDLAGKRVLIVDDEALIALTLKEAVEALGCETVGPAHSVGKALALVRENAPDLAILDVNLGGTSNAPVAGALRALGIPFIYCTGYAEPAEQIDPDLLAEMISKPIETQLLASALRRAAASVPGGRTEHRHLNAI